MTDSVKIDDKVSPPNDMLKQEAWQRHLSRGAQIAQALNELLTDPGQEGKNARNIVRNPHLRLKKPDVFDPDNCVLRTFIGEDNERRWVVVSNGDKGMVKESTAGPNALKIIRKYKAEHSPEARQEETSTSSERRWAKGIEEARQKQEGLGEISRVYGPFN